MSLPDRAITSQVLRPNRSEQASPQTAYPSAVEISPVAHLREHRVLRRPRRNQSALCLAVGHFEAVPHRLQHHCYKPVYVRRTVFAQTRFEVGQARQRIMEFDESLHKGSQLWGIPVLDREGRVSCKVLRIHASIGSWNAKGLFSTGSTHLRMESHSDHFRQRRSKQWEASVF